MSLKATNFLSLLLTFNCLGRSLALTRLPFVPVQNLLQCNLGPNYDSDIRAKTDLLQVTCLGRDTHCVRVEARLQRLQQSNGTVHSVVVGRCADDCSKLSCNQILSQFWSINYTNPDTDVEEASGFYDSSVLGLWAPAFEVLSCDITCCKGNNCNHRKISEIREENQPRPTTEKTDNGNGRGSSLISASFLVGLLAMSSISFVFGEL